jgi:uncharacterized protein (DUF2141 family)
MKYFNKPNVIAAATAAVVFSLNTTAIAAGSLTIEMLNLTSSEGQAIFVVMYSVTSHRGKAPIYTKSIVPIEQSRARFTLHDMPPGLYSAVAYHDQNGNGKLDRHFFGMPKEPYGFSNNARNKLGIPTFEDSRFEITSSQTIQKITVK